MTKIVVGLGNPGRQYEDTRHNAGWMVLDELAQRAGLTGHAKSKDAAATMRGRYNGIDLILVKPMTYMNESGIAVRKILARERTPLEDMLIVYDDFDLPLGKLRMREQGSAGTHNGMRSIVAELGTQKFARLRLGIGQPSRGAIGHVLTKFTAAERKVLDEVVDAAAEAVEDWAREGANRAATRWNGWLPPSMSEQPTEGGADDPPLEPTAPQIDGDGSLIVRTATGWRKLLRRG
ncbi:MAG TPA: aminoacyl-tRNA hydrolase [Candidatus Limnocylindrales bacterium]